jgi:hypothetical protein
MKLFLPLTLLVCITIEASAKLPIPSVEGWTQRCDVTQNTFSVAAGVGSSSIIVKKTMISKSHKVALYPDAEQKVLFFHVRGENGKVYQLFVFDMQGKIVKQAEIRNKQTTLIKDIEKGSYLFEVFSNDNRIGEGQIAVR